MCQTLKSTKMYCLVIIIIERYDVMSVPYLHNSWIWLVCYCPKVKQTSVLKKALLSLSHSVYNENSCWWERENVVQLQFLTYRAGVDIVSTLFLLSYILYYIYNEIWDYNVWNKTLDNCYCIFIKCVSYWANTFPKNAYVFQQLPYISKNTIISCYYS